MNWPLFHLAMLVSLIVCGSIIYFHIRARRRDNRRASNRVLNWHREHEHTREPAQPSQKKTVL